MKKMKLFFKKMKSTFGDKVPLMSLLSIGFVIIVVVALFSVDSKNTDEQTQNLESTIMKTAVHCYAIEGAYPSNLDYLIEEYNLSINSDKYIVHYEVFASNIAPDITVISK